MVCYNRDVFGRTPEPSTSQSILVINTPRFYFAVAALLLICSAAQPVCAEQNAGELQAKYDKLSQEFAAANPEWRPKAPATGMLLFIAPDEYSPLAKPAEAISEARSQYAAAVFELAKEAAEAGQLSLAFEWATETLRENPDHTDARRVLGYEQRDGQWLTAYGVKMFDVGKTWDPKRGWVSAKEDQRQISEQADIARHTDIRTGWQVRTDHFQITTNHSLAAGAELGARLEHLYQIWRQLFAGFYYTEKEVRSLFAGERNARVQSRPFRVFYYRSSESYVEALRRRQPKIKETLGIYFDNSREAHFYAGDDRARGTLFHEAVHQLFLESKPTAKQIGTTANYWIVEGIANYFETLTEHDDPLAGLYFTVGESTAGRLPAAREKVQQGFYIPLAELTHMSKDDIQRHPERAKLYSQSSGLAAFLLNGEHGRYREALVSYLQTVYAGRDDAGTLAEVTETTYPELDGQYHKFLQSP